MSFPNGSSAGLNGISLQILKEVGVGTKRGAELASHISHLGNFFRSYSLDLSCGPQPPYSVNNSPVKWVRDNLPKGNLPKPNFPNVKDNLPNFVSTSCPFEIADFCRNNLPNT